MPFALIKNDGSIVVLRLVEGTLEDALAQRRNILPDEKIASVSEIEEDQVPADREFRKAWRSCSKNGVRHCMATARDIHRMSIRHQREAYFAKTDVLLRDAIHLRRDASAVAEHAQELRDATKDPAIEQAGSIEELKRVQPVVFSKPIPPLGERLAPGESAQYDTKALENWAAALNEKIARLEAANAGGIQRDLQSIMAKVDEISSNQARRIDALSKQLDFVTERAAGKAVLTTEEVQQ